jgi:hypothetical protein
MSTESSPASELEPVEATHAIPAAEHPAIRITSPTKLLNVVPYMLGFQPDDSAAIFAVKAPKETVLLRISLEKMADPVVAAVYARRMVHILSTREFTKAVVVGYGPDDRVTPFVERFRDLAVEQGIEVQEILRAEGGRYWSYRCTDPACCPPEGTPYQLADDPELDRLLPIGASGVLRSREELAARIAPVTGAEATAMRQATKRAEARVTRLLKRQPTSAGQPSGKALAIAEGIGAGHAAIARFQLGGDITPGEAAWLTVSFREIQVRDDFWCRLEPAGRQQNLRLLIELTRLAQAPYVARAATLLAFVAWQCGNGALANLALDRALEDGPKSTMAKMIREALDAGAPPELARVPATPEEVAEMYAERTAKANGGKAGGTRAKCERR